MTAGFLLDLSCDTLNQSYCTGRVVVRALIIFMCSALSLLGPIGNAGAGATDSRPSGFPDWSRILETHGDKLAAVDSDQSAKETFVTTVGAAVSLSETAATIGAKALPAKMSKELLVGEITQSAQRLVAALAVWHLAEHVTKSMQQAGDSIPALPDPSAQRIEWLKANGSFPSLARMWSAVPSPGQDLSPAAAPLPDRTELALAAGQTALEASQQALSEWWRLKSWKERVRTLRGQTRLCGTWQWVIHNHQQHHQEQKHSLLFPPPGKDGTGIVGLAETIVLGDAVYLRWEIDGRVQEDSLLFTKEAQRLEGTFVNSQGGWGSISGKRTSGCSP
ncbi:MAG: conserved protein of unknown function [Nitrospira sp.]